MIQGKSQNQVLKIWSFIETDNLSAEQLSKIRQVLTNWSHIFSKGPTDLGKADIVKHEIKLTDNTPFKEPCRRIPPAIYE